jgi:hypothetical protein
MKNIFLLLFSVLFLSNIYSQNYNMSVDDHNGKVGKMHHAGVAIHIDLDKKEVKDEWKKELKKMGKVDSESGVYLIESARIPSVSPQAVRVLSTVESTSKGTRIWVSINDGNGYVKTGSVNHGKVKKFLQDFAKRMYRLDIERQVKDAQEAVATSKKSQEKVIHTGESLDKDLKENEEEKIKLETDIEQNVKDQELAVQNVADMQKALELVQQKLEKMK